MAMSPYCAIPEEILNRRKTGFSIPVHRWMMENVKKGLDIQGGFTTLISLSWEELTDNLEVTYT